MSSPMLQVLSMGLFYSRLNYDKMDLSVQDVRPGYSHLAQLPKNLQKVSFDLGSSRMDSI